MADTGFNLATLWVPVAPETSKIGPAMEQAGREAKGKFGQSVKGIGDSIHNDLAHAASKSKDAFTSLGAHISDTFRKVGGSGSSLNTVASTLDKVTGGGDRATSSIRALTDALGTVKSGDLQNMGGALQNVGDKAKLVGVDISEWSNPLQDAVSKSADVKSQVGEFANIFKDLPGRIGKVGGVIAELAGPIGIAVVGATKLMDQLDRLPAIHDRFMNPDGTPKNGIDDWFDQHGLGWLNELDPNYHRRRPALPGAPPQPITGDSRLGQMILGGAAPPPGQYPSNFIGPIPPGATRSGPAATPSGPTRSFYSDWYGPAQTPEPEPTPPTSSGRSGGTTAKGSGGYSGRLPSIGSSPAGLRTAGSRIAYLYSVAQSLVGTPYSQELRNDCSGMVSQLAAAALGMSPPSVGDRFTTVNEGEWLASHGFKMGMGRPGDLRIGWYDHGGGNFGHTAATLPGGEHAESGGSHGNFLIGPGAAGADNPEFEHHAYLPMGATGAGTSPAGGASPMGTEHDPLYVTQTDTESGAGGSPFEQQGQQLAQGMSKGFLELFGIDGSVLKGFGGGKSPLDFGLTKIGGGLLNSFLGMAGARGGTGGGGGGFGGDGAMLPGLSGLIPGIGGLIPSRGAAISANTVATPDGIAGRGAAAAGNTTIINGDVAPFNVHGVGTVGEQKEVANSSNRPQAMAAPNAGGMPLP